MVISNLSFCNKTEIAIYNEKEFETLGLVAQNPGKKYITFINEKKYFSMINSNVSMVITKPALKEFVPECCGTVISDNPKVTFFKLHNFLETNKGYIRNEYKTVIGKNCRIGKFASIAENNVIIGDNVVIEDFATVCQNTVIKDDVIIRSGAKVGKPGYLYIRCPDSTIIPGNHYGGTIIENHVDINYNACIERAVFPWDNTVIDEYTKCGDFVIVGHGAKLGRRILVCADSIVGGRTTVGDDSWIGIGSLVKNGITLGNKVSVNMGSVLVENLKDEKVVSGYYAIDQNIFFYHQIKMRSKR